MKTHLKAMTFYCEKLQEEVTVEAGAVNWSAHESCDPRSAGDISCEFMCKCGTYHEVEVDWWNDN